MKSLTSTTRGLGRWNSMLGVAVLAAQSGTFLILSPLVLRSLGPEAFGIWSLGSTVLAFATLLDLGIGEAAAQRVGELGGAKARPSDVSQIMSEATRHYRRLTAVGLACSPIVSLALLAAIQFRTLEPPVVLGYFLCASGGFFVGLPSYARAAVLVGRGETWAQRLPLLVESIVTFVVSLVALYFGLGLLALGLAIIVSRASGALVRAWVFERLVGTQTHVSAVPAGLERPSPLVSIRGAAIPFLLIALAARFEISIGPLLLAARVSVDQVGPYLFAFRCFFTLLQVTWQLTDYLFPAYRRLVADSGWASAGRLTEQSLEVTLPFVAVGSCLGAFVYDGVAGKIATGLVVGPVLTSLLALFAVVYHTVHVLALSASGCGLQKRVMPVIVAESAVGFATSLVLVGELGSAGIVIGIAGANAAIAIPALVRLWLDKTSWPLRRWAAPAVPAVAAIAALGMVQFISVHADSSIAVVANVVSLGVIAWNLLTVARRWPRFRATVEAALGTVRHSTSAAQLTS